HHRGLLRPKRGGRRGSRPPHPDPADGVQGPVNRCVTAPEIPPAGTGVPVNATPERPRVRTGCGEASPKGPELIPLDSQNDASVDPTEAKCWTSAIIAPGARYQLEPRRRRLQPFTLESSTRGRTSLDEGKGGALSQQGRDTQARMQPVGKPL